MLSKRTRLNLRAHPQFTKVFTSPYFILRIRKNDSANNKYGFLVSKRVDSRATVRNKIKRMMRKCIEEMLSEIKEGYDMLFIIKKEVLGISKDGICDTVRNVLVDKGYLQ